MLKVLNLKVIGSLRSVKVLNPIVIGSLRSLEVLKVLTLIRWKIWKVLNCWPKKWKGVR